ncbi:hypothetical protein BU24DRAFT_423049 [Aaosphaeria arxii CBS 175.79]|uniref:Uncharacterized protein n=1 Tax=Aaosphaeria arxii CBS 175.79 TaxID=1450172 RepID=A0A6A5XUS4_9PLEO|nr:uncharacterized protein BU24DRAFT_423049 [Aaosphaeria arxii CBS 175.79]KAF2016676.1 hypothetical protein BU24DRAFT_423049 [Aaosphaeria arxii CBS 175.79]
MTVFVTFSMGSKEAYFFNSPTHWAWHHLPPDVEALFTKQPPIKDVIECAIGENGAYFVSFRDHDGQVYCRHYNLPNALTMYLYHSHPQVIRDLTTLSITLGPYDSFYAHDKTSAEWSNLPPLLEKAILNRVESQDAWKTVWRDGGREAPMFVSLGADGSYFMRTVSGGGSWDLRSKSEGVMGTNKFLEDAPNFASIAGLYLFQSYPDSYVLLLMSGKTFSNLPEHTWADYNKMAPALPQLAQSSMPIPAIPQMRPPTAVTAPPQQQQFQQPRQFQQVAQTSCCAPNNQHTGIHVPLPPNYGQVQGMINQISGQLNGGAVYAAQPNQTHYQNHMQQGQTTGVIPAQGMSPATQQPMQTGGSMASR